MDAPATIPIRATLCEPPVRGVGWVLRRAATLAVFVAAAATLLEFGYRVSAERALAKAAAAGLREAALPRATRRSIDQAIRAQLAGHFALHRETAVSLQRNGWVLRDPIRPQAGDRLSVTLTAPADAGLPAWLRAAAVWPRGSALVAQATTSSF